MVILPSGVPVSEDNLGPSQKEASRLNSGDLRPNGGAKMGLAPDGAKRGLAPDDSPPQVTASCQGGNQLAVRKKQRSGPRETMAVEASVEVPSGVPQASAASLEAGMMTGESPHAAPTSGGPSGSGIPTDLELAAAAPSSHEIQASISDSPDAIVKITLRDQLREQLRKELESEFKQALAIKVKQAAEIGRRYADNEVDRLRKQLQEAEARHAARVEELLRRTPGPPPASPVGQRDMMDTMMKVSRTEDATAVIRCVMHATMKLQLYSGKSCMNVLYLVICRKLFLMFNLNDVMSPLSMVHRSLVT